MDLSSFPDKIASQAVRFSAQEKCCLHDWTSPAHISLESGMRKARKVVPITQGRPSLPSTGSSFYEECRLLTYRETPDGASFHLGPPLSRSSRAVHHQLGKILPFPARLQKPDQK